MRTYVIQIGNSDNKLTQNRWAHFVAGVQISVSGHCRQIHFRGGSDWDAPWQNACWVCVPLNEESAAALMAELALEAARNDQDSIAVTIGETVFVEPKPCK